MKEEKLTKETTHASMPADSQEEKKVEEIYLYYLKRLNINHILPTFRLFHQFGHQLNKENKANKAIQ
jgi:hypothetical protein